jgi:hypothetical protein
VANRQTGHNHKSTHPVNKKKRQYEETTKTQKRGSVVRVETGAAAKSSEAETPHIPSEFLG